MSETRREDIARIIEPGAWADFDAKGGDNGRTRRDREWSLERADAILGLLSTPASPSPRKEQPADIVRRWFQWIMDVSADMEEPEGYDGRNRLEWEKERILADLSAFSHSDVPALQSKEAGE
jgi:hypothetical protein